MTPDLITPLEALGFRFSLTSDARIDVRFPGSEPPAEALPLLAEVRAHRSEVLEELRQRSQEAAHPCVGGCGHDAGPEAVWCPSCWRARELGGARVLPFDPARRLRAEARHAARRCDACGGSWWRIWPRGDASCEACTRNRAPSPLEFAKPQPVRAAEPTPGVLP